MKGAEKEEAMASFARGEADVMVATTVIEVGVDVPNATLMVIEDADRLAFPSCISCAAAWDGEKRKATAS